MGEFGHFYAAGKNFRLDGWGDGPFFIEADGKTYRFGDSDQFGPYLADRHGDPIANPYPAERSPFWRAHWLWKRQGRRIEDGKCIWREPKPTLLTRRGRQIIVVEQGEPDGKDILDGKRINLDAAP